MATGRLANRGPVHIAGIDAPEKGGTVGADKVLIEDSEDQQRLKYVTVDNFTGGGSGTGWVGTVANVAALPTATGSGDVYLVENSTGLFWAQRKGLYQDTGTWERLSNATFQVLDSEAVFSDDVDSTKKLQFQLDSITTGNTRVISAPDRDLNLNTPVFDSVNVTNATSALMQQNHTPTSNFSTIATSSEWDFTFNRLAGSAIMDWRGLPLDNTSDSLYRVNLSNGSTGNSFWLFYNSNSTDIQHRLADSGAVSYLAAQGGDVSIGGTTASEKLDVTGNIAVSGTVDGRDVATDGTKLDGIEAGAEVNNISDANATDLTDGGDSTLHFHASDRSRANHTGTQTASTISDFATQAGIDGAQFWFQGDNFENPTTGNWAVSTVAQGTQDSINAGFAIRQFDDTTEEGVGMSVVIPASATNLTIKFLSRAQDDTSGNVVPKLYTRQFDDNANIPAWDSGTNLTALAMTTGRDWHFDSQTIALSTLSLDADKPTIFEVTRVGTDASDTLSGDWTVYAIWWEFS